MINVIVSFVLLHWLPISLKSKLLDFYGYVLITSTHNCLDTSLTTWHSLFDHALSKMSGSSAGRMPADCNDMYRFFLSFRVLCYVVILLPTKSVTQLLQFSPPSYIITKLLLPVFNTFIIHLLGLKSCTVWSSTRTATTCTGTLWRTPPMSMKMRGKLTCPQL